MNSIGGRRRLSPGPPPYISCHYKWDVNNGTPTKTAQDFLLWHIRLWKVLNAIKTFNIDNLNKKKIEHYSFICKNIVVTDGWYEYGGYGPYDEFICINEEKSLIIEKKIKPRGKWFENAKKIAHFIENSSWRGDNKFGQHMAEWRLNKDGIDLFM